MLTVVPSLLQNRSGLILVLDCSTWILLHCCVCVIKSGEKHALLRRPFGVGHAVQWGKEVERVERSQFNKKKKGIAALNSTTKLRCLLWWCLRVSFTLNYLEFRPWLLCWIFYFCCRPDCNQIGFAWSQCRMT